MVHQGISRRVLRGATSDPAWSLNLLFYRRGFGLVVSIVVPSMLAVLPYMREVAGSTPGLDFYIHEDRESTCSIGYPEYCKLWNFRECFIFAIFVNSGSIANLNSTKTLTIIHFPLSFYSKCRKHFFILNISCIWHGYVYKVYVLFQRNDIVFIHVVLGQRKMVSAKNGWDASQILWAVKRIEALKMNKYLHPGYFFLGIAIDPRMIQCQKSFMLIFQDICQDASRVKAKCTKADDIRTRLRHTLLVRLLRQSRHVSNIIYVVMTTWCVEHGLQMRGVWKVVQMTSSLFIRITK
jgi:hypothetical protein